MAEKILKGINFPGLKDTYIVPEQIQVDWNQTDETATNYIKNKPETLVECSNEEIKALFGV